MPERPRVVVVTGASAGVGRAVVREFAATGAHIGLIARGRDGLEGACREVEAAGGRASVLPCDVSDAEGVEQAAEAVERELGPIDVWVNNAMVSVFAPVHQITAAEYLRVTEVTYLGVVYGTLAALRRMRPRGHGVVVQVGSALAWRSIPLQSAYCAAKHAVLGFSEALRCELLHDRSPVRVTMVQLPAMNTPQFGWTRSRLPHRAQPVPPIYQPEVGARAVVYAADHPERRERWVGWPTVQAIVGERVFPGLLDHYLGRVGYRDQQTAEPLPERRDNLYTPVPGDHGAHGRFDDCARDRTSQQWLAQHEGIVATVFALLALLFGALVAA